MNNIKNKLAFEGAKADFIIISILIMVISYIEISFLMYTKPVLPDPIAIKKYDIMDEERIEREKRTGQDWIFWSKESYIDYSFEGNKKYINILFSSSIEVIQTKIYWGVDGIFEQDYESVENVNGTYNAIKIPKKEYNCAKIYLCNPVQTYEKEEDAEELLTWIWLKEICTSNGNLDWLKLYGGTFVWGSLGVFFIWAIFYGKNSWCRRTDFRYCRLLAFLFCFLLFLFIKQYFKFNGVCYFGDSGVYYQLAEEFVKEGKFSLYNYLSEDTMWSFRGYCLPWVIFLFKLPGKLIPMIGMHTSYEVLSSVFFAMVFAFGTPYLYKVFTGKNISFIRIMVVPYLLCIFARGLIAYPLSDFYCVAFSILSVCCVQKTIKETGWIRGIWAILAGICLYASYNIRTAWMFFGIGIIIIIAIHMYMQKDKGIFIVALGIALGILILGIPQYIINDHILEIKSPWVQNTSWNGHDESLVVWQLKEGIKTYRVESNLAAGASVKYIKGPAIATELEMELEEVHNVKDFIFFSARNPLITIKNIMVHFVMAADMRFPNITNKRLDIQNPLQNVYIVSFWSFFALTLMTNCKIAFKKVNRFKILWGIVFVLPALCQIMGAFESRFAIAIHTACFMFAAYGFSYKKLLQLKRKALIGGSVVTVGLICAMMWICNAVYQL